VWSEVIESRFAVKVFDVQFNVQFDVQGGDTVGCHGCVCELFGYRVGVGLGSGVINCVDPCGGLARSVEEFVELGEEAWDALGLLVSGGQAGVPSG
jgi:hypothetical protein